MHERRCRRRAGEDRRNDPRARHLRAAQLVVKRHGEDAAIRAKMRANELVAGTAPRPGDYGIAVFLSSISGSGDGSGSMSDPLKAPCRHRAHTPCFSNDPQRRTRGPARPAPALQTVELGSAPRRHAAPVVGKRRRDCCRSAAPIRAPIQPIKKMAIDGTKAIAP
jgi:hypothetical protein